MKTQTRSWSGAPLRPPRRVVLATKFGRVSHAGDGPGNLDSSWPTSAPQWRGPLRRLGTDGIDLYYSTGSTRTHH